MRHGLRIRRTTGEVADWGVGDFFLFFSVVLVEQFFAKADLCARQHGVGGGFHQ